MSLKDVLSAVKKSFQFSKVVTVNGVNYGLAVLSVDQEKKVNGVISSYENLDGLDYYKATKKELLCESIIFINEEVIGKVVKDVNAEGKEVEKDKAIALRELLGDFPTAIIDQLFEAYLDIKEQSEEDLKKSLKYDWFKTPEQRKKEAEDRQKEEEDKAEKVAKDAKAKETKIEEKDVELKKVIEPIEPVIPV